jgi:hypothetical protein
MVCLDEDLRAGLVDNRWIVSVEVVDIMDVRGKGSMDPLAHAG